MGFFCLTGHGAPAELSRRTLEACPKNHAAGDRPDGPILSAYGRNAGKSRLRAHPDVASAHGYSAGRVGDENPVLGSRGE
ncbi:hypothetical protein BST44_17730 [Mycobacterium scrofulaceum]|uniref:Uncharacterized protein n=1 Tax=Mycobacterium scrofulaceum TaxID=1783 RepID=A0A1X0KCE2_MYCSC|nr:hypothetical protein BST44_17730 [Mycobacterium scrofulaceum]